MTDREKLIALMVEAESLCAAIDCYDGAVCEYVGEINGCAAFRADHLIANGVVVREKGEWIGEGDGYADGEIVYDVWYCSECNHCIDDGTDDPALLPNFCPNCGADMRKGENNA